MPAYIDGELAIITALTNKLFDALNTLPDPDSIRVQFTSTYPKTSSIEVERFKNNALVDNIPTIVSMVWAGIYEDYHRCRVTVTGLNALQEHFYVSVHTENFDAQIDAIVTHVVKCFHKKEQQP